MGILIKNAEQIVGIQKSCKLAAQSLDMIRPFVIAGVTTQSLNDRINDFIRDHGAIPAPLNYLGFPKETCISLNEVVCHGIPDGTILKNGDILNIDVTTILRGYYGDTSSMFTVGEISAKATHLIDTTKECLKIGIEQVRPGAFIGDIGLAITKHSEKNGFAVVHQFVGHGTGLDFHEAPQVLHYVYDTNYKGSEAEVMREGMIFTIEPMLNEGLANAEISSADGWTATTVDGKLSAQFEHTVLVTSDGVEILTLGE